MRPKNQRLSLWVIMLSHSSAVQHHKLLVRLNLTESPTRIQPNPTESRKSNKLQWIQIVSNRWKGNIFRDKPPSERALQQLIFHKLTYEYKDPEPWSLAWTDTSWRSSLSDYGGAWWLYVGLAPGHSGTVWLQAGVARKNPVGYFLSGCGDQCIAEHLSESATQLVVDQAWEADMLRQLPTKSTPAPTWCRPSAHPLSKAWINRAASTATPTLHIDEFHFQPLDHPVALDPCTFISAPIWPPTTEECIKKNWPHVSLHFRST